MRNKGKLVDSTGRKHFQNETELACYLLFYFSCLSEMQYDDLEVVLKMEDQSKKNGKMEKKKKNKCLTETPHSSQNSLGLISSLPV